MRGTMRKILEREGHLVRDAPDGKKGIELFREEGADVVVTDLIMPEKEGIETIIELRAVSPGVRILAVSGADVRGHDGRLLDAEALGADASLAKPFTVDQLRNAVAALLS
ncbi:MAG: response regulator [Myxococcales bacterium]|nr:response regulator [Myxococcales bacterium]